MNVEPKFGMADPDGQPFILCLLDGCPMPMVTNRSPEWTMARTMNAVWNHSRRYHSGNAPDQTD
jgi:hypothetical protein